jgi:hypothetical protein
MLLKILPCALYTSPLSVRPLHHTYLTYLMLRRQFSHLNGGKLDRRQVEASYIFCLASPLVLVIWSQQAIP